MQLRGGRVNGQELRRRLMSGERQPTERTTEIGTGFVKIGDFEGEATDAHHRGWSICHGLSAPITHSTGGFQQRERTAGATCLGDALIVKDLDSASVKVKKACATGQLLPKVTIELCTIVGGSTEPYLAYELENVIVTNYDLIETNQEGRILPCECVKLSYTKVTWTYTKYDTVGKSKGKVTDSYAIGEKSS
jgi:type VI secretion system secreted protein Hcp